jgi:hypothetical protein
MPVILTNWKTEIRQIAVQGQPREEFQKIQSQPLTGHSGVDPVIYWRSKNRGPGDEGIKWDPISK